jgi:uncharacterized protein (DUF1697 family)
MARYVAFLRAINVGGHTVKMDELRAMFIEMGFANVETFIASGNVVFDSKSKSVETLEKKIEEYLHAKLGYEVITFVRSIDELAQIAAHKPFEVKTADGERVFIGFLSAKLAPAAVRKIEESSTEADIFHIKNRELFWLCRTKMSDSKFFGPLLEKTLGTRTTLRNANTVNRIIAKYT